MAYAIVGVGLLTAAISVAMIANPKAFGRGILAFSQKPFFHWAEIAIRVGLGGVLVGFAAMTQHPKVIAAVGYLFLFAGAFLLVAGPTRHRTFAEKSAGFVAVFRPAGVLSLFFGLFLCWSALGKVEP
jgi:hypothetical protein